ALTSIGQRLHIPDDDAIGGVRDANPREVRSDPAKHVDVNDHLTIVRCVEVEGRPAGHIPECNLAQWPGGPQETDENKQRAAEPEQPCFHDRGHLGLPPSIRYGARLYAEKISPFGEGWIGAAGKRPPQAL